MELYSNQKIVKKILHAGTEAVTFQPETKVTFNFQTKLLDENNTLIDDSRKWNKPMQLILGRKFKLPVWETIVQNMSLNEVAKYVVDKSLLDEYPIVSKVYRDDAQNKAQVHHCHGSMANAGLGYEDLNKLMRSPQNLEFIFELIKVEHPGQYEKELWQINEEDRKEMIPQLKDEGNQFYQSKDYSLAIEKYKIAMNFIEQLQLREKPHEKEWNDLNLLKLPFYLNLAQCYICTEEYYPAIEHCKEALKIDSNNIKALFRRGRAYLKTWNLKDAKNDLNQVVELDPSQKSAVTSLLNSFKEIQNDSKNLEKSMMRNIIT